ncbi:hypothetical protein [Cohnella zeiphila]|uniref:Uncharacterized protein n=1 Tax=Cohnella zeiphila TaxID=2761120 RepID=A0A7X0SKE2_9BACL|nr:hypothetical protein [Cohnella zeiphila]MBB6729378.1 hypothetical protein [Cohnella zeiphila]
MGEWSNKRNWAERQFATDARLGIALPRFTLPWEAMSPEEQAAVLERWETIRGRIPDRVIGFEAEIRRLQDGLFEEESFERSCRLNSEIAELASRINDLNIWYRTEQDFEEETRRHA